MTSPARYTCPSCDAHFDAPSKYCRVCGTRMDGDHDDHDDEDIATDDTINSGKHEVPETNLTPGVASEPSLRRRASDDRRPSWLGRVVDSRYRVIEVIGRGGMGMVYKVEHQRMGKIAAMKVLHQEYDEDPEIVERFHREAEAVSRLEHPNTVQVFDFGSSLGSLYLIMEFIRGQNLSVLLHRDGPMAFERAGAMFMQICAAVAEAHSKGVIHRDIKPENVLVTRTHRGRDVVKVLDFGLAKLSEREDIGGVTDKGMIVGTPYYMSPEQIRGEDVDERADIYSMGALMYRALSGVQAFNAKTPMGVLTQHLTGAFVEPSKRARGAEVPAVLDDIIARAMAKDRDRRFGTMEMMLDAIEVAFMEICGQNSSLSLGVPAVSAGGGRGRSGSESEFEPMSRAATVKQNEYGLDDSDEIDYGILSSVRLQRSDLDQFERALLRRRWFGLSLVPLCLAALLAVPVYVLFFRQDGPKSAEAEPNDQLDNATLIAPGTQVTGYLGKRMDKSRSDHDFYRVQRARHAGDIAIITAHVTALPNMDIELSLLDATGKIIAHADEGAVAHDEWLHRYRVRGPFSVLVTEARKHNLASLPTENISDAYTLSVDVDTIDTAAAGTGAGEHKRAEREIEPNENPSDAHVLHLGEPVTAYLDHRTDIDSFRFAGEPGSYELDISDATQVPLAWQLGDGPRSQERQTIIELRTDDVIRVSRTDHELAATQSLPGVSSPYIIELKRRSEP